MSSNATLEYDYVISWVEDIDHLQSEPTEKGSSVHQKRKGMRCFVCRKTGHLAKDCSSKQDDDSDDAGAKGKHQSGSKGQKGNWNKGQKPVKQKGRSAEDHEDSLGDISEEEYGTRMIETLEAPDDPEEPETVTHVAFIREDAY